MARRRRTGKSQSRNERIRLRVLESIGRLAGADETYQNHLRWELDTMSYPEYYEAILSLFELGLIEDSGRRKKGRIVWCTTEAGEKFHDPAPPEVGAMRLVQLLLSSFERRSPANPVPVWPRNS
jgi:hypothetical protein